MNQIAIRVKFEEIQDSGLWQMGVASQHLKVTRLSRFNLYSFLPSFYYR